MIGVSTPAAVPASINWWRVVAAAQDPQSWAQWRVLENRDRVNALRWRKAYAAAVSLRGRNPYPFSAPDVPGHELVRSA